MTVTDWFRQNCMTWNHEKCHCICIGQNIDQHGFKFADLSKEVEILGVNTNNKYSFNSRTKIFLEKLVRYSVPSLGAHLDNDHKIISLNAGPRKSKNIHLESKGSLQPFSNTDSTILWKLLSNNTQINLYQRNKQISLIEICKITNN